MNKIRFDIAVKQIVGKDPRYQPDGYVFIRDTLTKLLAEQKNDELEEHRHVSGEELLQGVVNQALASYGSMGVIVLDTWGIRIAEDIGHMVFNLIDAGAFGKSEEDSLDGFRNKIDLHRELTKLYCPSRPVLSDESRSGSDMDPPSRGNQPARSNEI